MTNPTAEAEQEPGQDQDQNQKQDQDQDQKQDQDQDLGTPHLSLAGSAYTNEGLLIGYECGVVSPNRRNFSSPSKSATIPSQFPPKWVILTKK